VITNKLCKLNHCSLWVMWTYI